MSRTKIEFPTLNLVYVILRSAVDEANVAGLTNTKHHTMYGKSLVDQSGRLMTLASNNAFR